MGQLLKLNNKEEAKSDCQVAHENGSQSPNKREVSVLGQVTNSFVTSPQIEMKGEILGQLDYNQEMNQNIGSSKPAVKKPAATNDAKKKWMRRI